MKKIFLLFLIFILINNVFFAAGTKKFIQNHKIIYVDDDGGADYTLIQDALDNASDGDTIYVYSGIYYEHIKIKKSIKLLGEDKNTTIIDGNHTGNVVSIKADSVTIKGFTIKNCGENLSYTKNNIDTALEICSKNNTIVNNIITWDYFVGLFYNPAGIKIYLYSDNNNISNNEILQCKNAIRMESSNNIINNNQIEMNGGKGICLFTTAPDVPYCSNNNISNNVFYSITNKYLGLAIVGEHVENNTLYNNTISDIYGGIHLVYSNYNRILKNNIKNCVYWGLSISSSYRNIVLNNTISLNKKAGIYLGYGSSRNLIQNNNITKNRIGIYLTNNKLNKFYENNFIKNKRQVKFALKSLFNHWSRNYWDNQIIHGLPKILFGLFGRFIPWFNLDFHPVKKPYKI
ncbi:MAG: pectinesterase family protein [Candidatus Thermoplasmatota archaeon]|jgi:parallel beta-helix repeat protein|nr:pectinesterase family protein [Candidatus Thermoplasmatota archaeon]